MFKRVLLLITLLCLLASASLAAEELPPIISGVNIIGNKTIPEAEIMNVVFSRIGDSLVEEKLKGDIKAVYGLGYFKDVSATFEATPGGTKVIFKVVENPVVSQVVFEGNTVFSTAELMALTSSEAGKILNYKILQGDISAVNALYKDKGYTMARIVDVDTEEKTNILRFKITEGIVESLSLQGNDNTKDYVILRELKTKPGSIFNEVTFRNDLRRIFNLGFFSEIVPNFEPGSAPDKIVVVMNMKETRTTTVNFGGGFGEREGWFGFLDLSINNLYGTGQGLLIRGQSGQSLSTYQFKYFNPWFYPEKFGDKTSFTFRRWLTIGRDVYLTEQDARYNGFDFAFGKPLSDYYNLSWTLGSELVSPYNTSSFEAYQSDTIGATIAYDTRDFWLNPKEGKYYTLAVKQGWKRTGITTAFLKLGVDINNYHPVIENQILAFHAGAGIGFDDIPVGELYWAGGANTISGYYPSEAHKGKRKLLFNLEYRLNFSDLFQGVFFCDLGDAWSVGDPDFSNFLSSWGPGIRINTPLGPIRLDYGVAKGKTFSEGVMHFSIGQAF